MYKREKKYFFLLFNILLQSFFKISAIMLFARQISRCPRLLIGAVYIFIKLSSWRANNLRVKRFLGWGLLRETRTAAVRRLPLQCGPGIALARRSTSIASISDIHDDGVAGYFRDCASKRPDFCIYSQWYIAKGRVNRFHRVSVNKFWTGSTLIWILPFMSRQRYSVDYVCTYFLNFI